MKTIKKTRLGLERETLVELRHDELRGVAGGVAPVPRTMYCPPPPPTCNCCPGGGQP